MFKQFKKIANASVLKPLVKGILGLFTKKANPAAKKYAMDVADKACDGLPDMVETMARAALAYETAGATLGLELGMKLVDNVDTVKEIALLPAKAIHHYKNYQFLNGVVDGHLTQHEEDDFVVITDPEKEAQKAFDQKAKLGLNIKKFADAIIVEDFDSTKRMAARCA
jgi:hypothetical protein